MKIRLSFRRFSFLLLGCAQAILAQERLPYEYVFPKPNSQYVSSQTNIILRPGKEIDPSSINPSLISVEGSKSGTHRGRMVLSDDRKTIVFNLVIPFVENERVRVDVSPGLRTVDGENIRGVSYRFATAVIPVSPSETHLDADAGETRFTIAGDTLPADFPPIKIDTVSNPAPGEIFIGGFGGIGGTTLYANYLIIADNSGKPLAYKRIGTQVNPFAYMFKSDPAGTYSYIDRTPTATNVRIVDSSFTQIDTYPRGNPAGASHADFLLLPNGHALVLYFDIKTVDMSSIVKGGHPAANVTGCLIQEFDLNKNVVFQWSGFDYLPITDTYEDTLAASFAYSHVNGLDLDHDGNILISSRHMSQIIKIDRNTGNVIWRLGGKRNEFTFLNEHAENSPLYLSYPHHVQRLPNGNIILFDNGNQRVTKYSRVVEYKLDEINKTASMVWEYRQTPDIYASAQGSVQRLPNGNTLIGWGEASLGGKPAITEVRPDKSIVFELSLPLGYRSMRVYRLPWKPLAQVASWTKYELLAGNPYSFNDTATSSKTGVKIKYNELSGAYYNSTTVQRYSTAPVKPVFSGRSPWLIPHRITLSQFGIAAMNAEVSIDVAVLSGTVPFHRITVYQRDTVGKGFFSPLPTSYNSVKNEIVAVTSRFGEFAFCLEDTDSAANAPTLLSPTDGDSLNQRLPVGFAWNPNGYITGYQLQVAGDSLFYSLVLNDSLLTSATDTLRTVMPGARYFWRVRARNFGRMSQWSGVRSFRTISPYIAIFTPAGGEAWSRGSSYFIKWKSNIRERVRIELLKGTTKVTVVRDSVTNVGAYSWSVPSTLQPDSSYRIRITSIADSTVSSTSARGFFVTSGATAIGDCSTIPYRFELDQNHPNPFNPRTAISYSLASASGVRLQVFDVLGREITTLVDEPKQMGFHTVSWDASAQPSGVYLCRLEAYGGSSRFVHTIKMLLAK